MNKKINVVIADDNRFFCEALADFLNNSSEINITKTEINLQKLIEYTNNNSFDVLILDINFNGTSSLDFIDEIRPNKNEFKIIVLTTMNNNFIKTKASKLNIAGFIGKDEDLNTFKDIIIDTYNNGININPSDSKKVKINNLKFTLQQLYILETLYKHSDKTESELSEILETTVPNLKYHKQQLFQITDTKNISQLIKFGIQNGLIIP